MRSRLIMIGCMQPSAVNFYVSCQLIGPQGASYVQCSCNIGCNTLSLRYWRLSMEVFQPPLKTYAVFQLGIFLRALRPAGFIQRPARIILFLCFQTADIKMFINACRFMPMFSSIAHKKLCPDLVSFACWIVPNFFCTLPFAQPSWNTVTTYD